MPHLHILPQQRSLTRFPGSFSVALTLRTTTLPLAPLRRPPRRPRNQNSDKQRPSWCAISVVVAVSPLSCVLSAGPSSPPVPTPVPRRFAAVGGFVYRAPVLRAPELVRPNRPWPSRLAASCACPGPPGSEMGESVAISTNKLSDKPHS
jgi:hypothetical protein